MVAAMEDATGADPGLGADDAVGADVGGGVDLCGGVDDGAGVDAGFGFGFGEEEGQYAGEGDAGAGDADEGFCSGDIVFVIDEDCGGGALDCAGEVGGIFCEGQVPGAGFIGGGEAMEFQVWVADHLSFEVAGYVVGADTHGLDASFAGDLVIFVENDDTGLPVGGLGGVREGEVHDCEGVAGFSEVCGGAVEDELAGLSGAGYGVGFEAGAVGHISHEDSFVGEEADFFHEVGRDGEAAFVIDASACDSGAVDLGFEEVDLHRCRFWRLRITTSWAI